MVRITRALKWPFTRVRQAWEDYQVGRAMRQRDLKASKVDPEEEAECEDKCDEECKEVCKDGTLNQCEEECNDLNKDRCNDKALKQPVPCSNGEQELEAKYSAQIARTWEYKREAEFPWRHAQLVYEESNWRGTWVLEVKDMQAMNWEIEFVPKETGRGRRVLRRPTRHLPFPLGEENAALLPSEGGQDDLMVWLGKS